MIIDTHAHIGKMLIFDMPEEDLLYSIEKYGIDFSLVPIDMDTLRISKRSIKQFAESSEIAMTLN